MPQKVRSWSRTGSFSANQPSVIVDEYTSTSNTTLKPTGKPDLRAQNPFSLYHSKLLRSSVTVGRGGAIYPLVYPHNAIDNYCPPDWTVSDNQAYAKFKGRLRYGSANLGVAIGEWKSSSDMIYNRSVGLLKALDRTNRDILKDRALRKKIKERGVLMRDILFSWDDKGNVTRLVDRKIDPKKRRQINPGWSLRPGAYVKDAADKHLEIAFGWTPLIQDINAALTTVCQEGIPPEWVTARGKSLVSKKVPPSGTYQVTSMDFLQTIRTTYCVNVAVTNPNLWLLNRMGLVNPLGVAWDLVPFSFVVNMFVNVNTMIGSLTDTLGLTLTNQSITRSVVTYHGRVDYSSQYIQPWETGYGASTSQVFRVRRKNRVLNTPLKPTMVARVPELDLNLLAITSSLVVQRMSKIARLFT